MASIVLSGAKNVSYTNDTGQNVRLVINHLSDVSQITWAGNTKVITERSQYAVSYRNQFGNATELGITGGGRPFAKTRPRQPGDTILGLGTYDSGGVGSKFYIEDGFSEVNINTGTVVTLIYNGQPNIPFTAGPVINSSVKTFGGIMQEGDNAGGVGDGSPPILIFEGGTESVSRNSRPGGGWSDIRTSIPRTIFLSPGQSFNAICRAYNIVVIKEDGN